jgi:hypothetical protein
MVVVDVMDVSPGTRESRYVLLSLVLLFVFGCGADISNPVSTTEVERPPDDPGSLSDALVSNLFDWPATPFGRGNSATIETFLTKGDVAVDFTLDDLEGSEWTLSELLKTGPVLLLPGSYTCPVYQARIPELNELFVDLLPDGRSFGEAVHFVHVYVVEAHPKLPDPTPYKSWTDSDLPVGGEEGQDNYAYSIVGQAYSYAERVASARRLNDRIYGDQVRLVDELTPHGLNNPIWGTYGTAPDAGYLIGRDGTIVESQLWVRVDGLRAAILRELGFVD